MAQEDMKEELIEKQADIFGKNLTANGEKEQIINFNNMKKIRLFVLLLSLTSCEGCHMDVFYTTFHLKNETENDCKVYFCIKNCTEGVYPDTTLLLIDSAKLTPIKAQKGIYFDYAEHIEELFSRMPTDTLSFFWFNADTLNKYLWHEIQSGYKIMARYDLSIQDLDKYIISYPPDDEMLGKKIYLPYKQ